MLWKPFNVRLFPIYLFIFIVFLNRYVFGLYLTIINRKKLAKKIHGYEPTPASVVKPARESMLGAPQTEGARS